MTWLVERPSDRPEIGSDNRPRQPSSAKFFFADEISPWSRFATSSQNFYVLVGDDVGSDVAAMTAICIKQARVTSPVRIMATFVRVSSDAMMTASPTAWCIRA